MDLQRVHDLVMQLYETDQTMHAWMCERIAIYGTLDYTFFEWYYSKRVEILRELEGCLNVQCNS